MPRVVRGPDGVLQRFHDNADGSPATDAQISAALKAIPQSNGPAAPKARTWSDRLGLNEGTASIPGGFARGAASAAVDMAQGVTRNVTGQASDLAKGLLPSDSPMSPPVTPEEETRMDQAVPDSTGTVAGTVGELLPVVAEMVAGGKPPAKAALDAIPRTARAAGKFKEVMGAAGQLPVDVTAPGNVALRIQELAERGGSMPMAVRKFLGRVTDPAKAPMNYEEARDFASNISRLSADEFGRLTPVVAREVAEMRVALNKAIAETAKQAGKLPEYESAMKEYARAMRAKSIIKSAVEGAKKSAPFATVAGTGYWLSKKLGAMLEH